MLHFRQVTTGIVDLTSAVFSSCGVSASTLLSSGGSFPVLSSGELDDVLSLSIDAAMEGEMTSVPISSLSFSLCVSSTVTVIPLSSFL